MSDLRFYGQGKLMLPPGVTTKRGDNFIRKGELIPDVALKAMGRNKVESMVAAGTISNRHFYDGKPDAEKPSLPDADTPRPRGRPSKASAEPDPAGGGVGPKE